MQSILLLHKRELLKCLLIILKPRENTALNMALLAQIS